MQRITLNKHWPLQGELNFHFSNATYSNQNWQNFQAETSVLKSLFAAYLIFYDPLVFMKNKINCKELKHTKVLFNFWPKNIFKKSKFLNYLFMNLQ